MLQEIIPGLLGAAVVDIRVPGFVASDGSELRFYPHLDSVYLCFEYQCLRFQSDRPLARLRISAASGLSFDFQKDPDDQFGWCSVMELFVREQGAPVKLTSFTGFLTAGADRAAGLVDAVEIGLSERTRLFLDPMNTFGVRLGNADDRRSWEEQHRQRGRAVEIVEFNR